MNRLARSSALGLVAVAMLAAGCTSGGLPAIPDATPTPSATPAPSTHPSIQPSPVVPGCPTS
jgi:hypothetical protein